MHAVFRSDAFELMPEYEDVRRFTQQFRTFAELLVNERPAPSWSAGALARRRGPGRPGR